MWDSSKLKNLKIVMQINHLPQLICNATNYTIVVQTLFNVTYQWVLFV
jgi:hypothetical protein